jgi:NADPH:quinone reductase-like Zn-dependent oxidoreductase
LAFGLFWPSIKILGADFCGIIKEKGSNASQDFEIGDVVIGDASNVGFGAFAEYISVPESVLVKKPKSLSHNEAAALPLAGVTALVGVRDHAQIQKGERIAITGASSGVGHFAVQIAKSMGAHVTAIASESKLDFIKTLGADQCLSTTEWDKLLDVAPQENQEKFDAILDIAAYQNVNPYLSLLEDPQKGRYIVGGGSLKELLRPMFNSKIKSYVSTCNQKDLQELADLADQGKIKPIIDTCFTLEETAKAMEYVMDRKVKGKVVVTVTDP